jgi:hypothetical protein
VEAKKRERGKEERNPIEMTENETIMLLANVRREAAIMAGNSGRGEEKKPSIYIQSQEDEPLRISAA